MACAGSRWESAARYLGSLVSLMLSFFLSYAGLFSCGTCVSSSCLLWDWGCVRWRLQAPPRCVWQRALPMASCTPARYGEPQRLLQQLIYSVQTPVALFWFLAIIAQKLGLAVSQVWDPGPGRAGRSREGC